MPGYHLPYFAAIDAGVFQRHGLDVDILDLAPGVANIQRVAQGGADFGLTSVAYYLQAWAAQKDVAARFVFMLPQRAHMAAFVVEGRPLPTGRIPQHPRDLAGARIGGEPQSGFVKSYLGFAQRVVGLSDTSVQAMSYTEAMTSLGTGTFDIFADYIDLLPRLRRKNPGVPIRTFHFADYGLSTYGSGLIASQHVIQERPEVVQRMVGALREALLLTREKPEVGLGGLLSRFPDTEADFALEGWHESARLIFGWEAATHGPGWFDAEMWRNTLRYEAAVQGLPLPPLERTYDTQFVAALASA